MTSACLLTLGWEVKILVAHKSILVAHKSTLLCSTNYHYFYYYNRHFVGVPTCKEGPYSNHRLPIHKFVSCEL